MAKKQQARPQNTGEVGTRSFDKSLQEDIKDFHLSSNVWTQARNAVNNSGSGDLGGLGNEASNELCAQAPYTIIGAIHIEADQWAIFSTNNVDSEIGIFEEEICNYTTVVNDPCLAFHTHHLIKGESREIFDCTFQVYWADGNNTDRSMNLTNVPWIQDCQIINDCNICTDTDQLDCDKIRLAPLVTAPCFDVRRGATGGTMLNGSYFVVAAYTINGQRVTDYSTPSNVQSLFEHSNSTTSLDISIEEMDPDYDEFELVIVSIINQTTSARRVGTYSTRQQRISIDHIDDRWPSVGIDLISLRNPIVDKSDAMYSVGEYLVRVGPTDKFDFNYQPLANQIGVKWQSVEYPADYYRKGGNNTGHMRDEVYPYFIQWVWDTGDKTASFHIPGIYADPTGPQFDILAGSDAQVDLDDGVTPFRWRVENSAAVTALPGTVLDDGGVVVAEGDMGYWESSEIYDDDKPDIWNANVVGQPGWDLCGKQIRHHRFPDNVTGGSQITNHYNAGGSSIRIMGVRFLNIQPPVDNDGNIITSIVGYEILRGSREGNKTVIAKGMINNMVEYDIPGGITPRKGLFPNYPYNDLRPDLFLGTVDSVATCVSNSGDPSGSNYNPPIDTFSRDKFTFHGPETQFSDPFLDMSEMKIYGSLIGQTEGQFIFPEKHPKHKFVTDLAFFVAIVGGLGSALIARNGQRSVKEIAPSWNNIGFSGTFGGTSAGTQAAPGLLGAYSTLGVNALQINEGTSDLAGALYNISAGVLLEAVAGDTNNGYYGGVSSGWNTSALIPGVNGPYKEYNQEIGPQADTPLFLRLLNTIPTFSYYFGEGVDTVLRLITSIGKFRQHALQYQSHCFYNNFVNPVAANNRRGLGDQIYITPHLHDFGTGYRINNLYRGKAVAIAIDVALADPIGDNSRQTVGTAFGPTYEDPEIPFNTTAVSHYVALKQRIRNQYGQIENIIQVPSTECVIPTDQRDSPTIFGGDIYIGRYTEKNTFYYFKDWLFGQPDGAAFNYALQKMIPHPRFWADTEEYDFNEFSSTVLTAIFSSSTSFTLPSSKHVFDRVGCPVRFLVKEAYFYLFNSGIRDFFVESEINVDLRDWEDEDTRRHYDPYRYTDIGSLFDMSIIKATNFFKYDQSLSISNLYNNYVSWASTHERDYDPNVAEQCYQHREDRVIYSLPQNLELKRDYWSLFLPNNYRDFKSRVTAIKEINKSGALILFENEAPVQFLGVDQLQTDSGTKITIGDGGLFNQPLQNVLNAERPYEYGSCQNRLAVINTPHGTFWMCQNQGKIFTIADGVKEISQQDIKWWLSKFMPYKLTEDFPDFELTDNPIDGIGCQAIYDNKNQMVYFCKKDYQIRDDVQGTITYESGNQFLLNGRTHITLGDLRFFREASWTISYDPKGAQWIGYHDWHPHLLIPGKKNFLSTLNEGIWEHNARCDSYCNFYGVDYPFEVEYTVNTIQVVNTLRSVEYQLEVYKYDPDNCYDRFHDLDFNFDEVVIYNTEQCSGLLRLNLSPVNNPGLLVQYPIINPTFIDILFSKEEQKYRFNQFWDITQDRGEFNSAAERVIWNTEPNGYIRNLNPNNLNYNKGQTQRKKFRHYTNTVLLRRRVSGDRKMIVLLANNKNLRSPR